jgi:hypothetical protein
MLVHYLKALTYFEEAEAEPMPQMQVRLSWPQVRRAMDRRERAYVRQMGGQ